MRRRARRCTRAGTLFPYTTLFRSVADPATGRDRDCGPTDMTRDILDCLIIWSDQRIAGELAIDRGGAMHFTYAADWLADPMATPLSHALPKQAERSEEHPSELQSLMRISYAVFCLTKTTHTP